MKLFKYQSDNDHLLENLKNKQIWFSNLHDLNDPSEGKIPFEFFEPNELEWIRIHEIA